VKKVIWSVLALSLLGGCAVSENQGQLREVDLRKPLYEYVDRQTHMDLATVQRNLFIHREACHSSFELKQDPLQVHFSTLIYGPEGVTDLRERVMLDFTAYASGKLGIKGYTYYAKNKALAQGLVDVLAKPTTCPAGIKPKTE